MLPDLLAATPPDKVPESAPNDSPVPFDVVNEGANKVDNVAFDVVATVSGLAPPNIGNLTPLAPKLKLLESLSNAIFSLKGVAKCCNCATLKKHFSVYVKCYKEMMVTPWA